MGNDFLCGLTGKANRNGNCYFNTENVLAICAFFTLGWLIATAINRARGCKTPFGVRIIDGIKYLATGEGFLEVA